MLTEQHAGVEEPTTPLEPMGLLHELLHVSQLMVIIVDPRGSICFINRECEQVTG